MGGNRRKNRERRWRRHWGRIRKRKRVAEKKKAERENEEEENEEEVEDEDDDWSRRDLSICGTCMYRSLACVGLTKALFRLWSKLFASERKNDESC